jgi:hypothetical protein
MLNPTINQNHKGEEHSRAVSNVESPHNTNRVNNQVTFSDEQDDEIQNRSPVECNSQSNEWQMPDKIDLDSSGLWRSAESAVLSQQDWVYSHSTMSFKTIKQSLKHACLVLFSSFCANRAGLKCGVHSHQVLAKSSSLLSNAIGSYHCHWVNLL